MLPLKAKQLGLKARPIPSKLRHGGGVVAQIFLSYSRRDADAAEAVAGALKNSGHDVWWDKHISGGSKFAAEIEQALNGADVVIVLWSRESIGSPWVLDEAAEGRDTGRLLPIALDDCKPPLGFRQFQTIVAHARLEAALDEAVEVIARRAGESPEASPAAEPTGGGRGEAASRCEASRRLQERGELDAAWREIEAALALEADSPEACREAGWILYLQGKYAEATAYYERAAALSKRDHESPAMLISCYRATGDAAGLSRASSLAVARAEHCVAGAMDPALAFASGARGLAALGHRERARKWIRKALNLEPGNLPLRYRLASTLATYLEDPEAAIDALEPFVEAVSKPIHVQLLETDPHWEAMREAPGFQALVGRARKRVDALASTA